MGQSNNHMHVLPPSAATEEPTVGVIKRALHELSSSTSAAAKQGNAASLREAHDLLRQLALRNGIDPDDALRRRLAAVASLRERMVLASATAPDQTSG